MKKGKCYSALIFFVTILITASSGCMRNPDQAQSSETVVESSSAETPAKTDKEIVEAVMREWYPSSEKGSIANCADEAIENAEKLSEKILGKINSEDDVKENLLAACVEMGWSKGEEEKGPYKIEFYDKYGVWAIDSYSPPNSINSEGEVIPSPPGSGYCSIIRKSDGKVLAIWLS